VEILMSDPESFDPPADESVVATLSEPKSKRARETATKRQPPYHVIILNDEVHSFDYVIELLAKIFGHPRSKGEDLAWTIHRQGRAVVMTTHKELAELKRDQVIAYGPDPRMASSTGPLGCYIEPAPSD
jgi:ATP-dependent Clp protease adaptor protein ClpS